MPHRLHHLSLCQAEHTGRDHEQELEDCVLLRSMDNKLQEKMTTNRQHDKAYNKRDEAVRAQSKTGETTEFEAGNACIWEILKLDELLRQVK